MSSIPHIGNTEPDAAAEKAESDPSELDDAMQVDKDVACQPSHEHSSDAKCGGLVFASYESGLLPYFKSIASKQGFVLGQGTHLMGKARAKAMRGTDDIIQRRPLYCRNGKKSGKRCPYKVPFTYVFKSKEYVIKTEPDGLCAQHNHPVARNELECLTQKRFEAELTPEEFAFMTEIGAYIPAGKLRRMMRWRFPNIDYSDDLMYRVRVKGRSIVFGNDPDSINAFMSMGKEIISEGGVFEISYDESKRIGEIYVQKPSLKQYAKAYGDFTILDGTFNKHPII